MKTEAQKAAQAARAKARRAKAKAAKAGIPDDKKAQAAIVAARLAAEAIRPEVRKAAAAALNKKAQGSRLDGTQARAILTSIYRNESLTGLISYLAGRWADEKEYEDLEDYANKIRSMLPAEASLTKMTSRPFGFFLTVGDLTAKFSLTARGLYTLELVK